ncbi:hypothetical protein [Gemmiger sp.]
MVKKIISVATAFLMLCCMVPFYAFAESATCPKCGKDTLITNQDISVEIGEKVGLPLSLKRAYCSNCHYAKYEYNVLGVAGEQAYDDGDESHIINFLKSLKEQLLGKNATAEKFTPGGGSTSGGGAGRRPSGYADDNGTPSISSDGGIIWQPTWDDLVEKEFSFYYARTYTMGAPFFTSDTYDESALGNLTFKKGVSDVVIYLSPKSGASSTWSFSTNSMGYPQVYFKAPIKGKYSRLITSAVYSSALEATGNHTSCEWNQIYDVGTSIPSGNICFRDFNTVQVKSCYWHFYLPKYKIVPYSAADKPTASANITINNNTWNGNIYTDNSTNLTYIYPQYTTVNEKNETVTNISTNPIIYNNETKQYYTYDQTTKNYYYIYYGSDSPTPSPTPAPSPTPTPGGSGTGGGGDVSTPETGKPGNSSGSSWWDKLLSKIGDAIIDGLLGAVSAVLKLIFKLFSTILSWIIWAVSRVFDLLPFLPPGLGGLLVGGVVVCFVIGIIKFIRG